MKPPAGFILWQGPSLIDGAPIVAILTSNRRRSANEKTGAMLQTWILRADVDPWAAVKSGADVSVCGDCKHRPAHGGACYVRVYQAPLSVYRALKRGRYAAVSGLAHVAEIGRGRRVRIGSYGDPLAVPAEVWRALISGAVMHTGYTHQWRETRADAWRGFLMASADTPAERETARASGWRTFTVRLKTDPLAERESVCPASAEAGHKTNCAKCGACNGADSGRRGSVAILAHGPVAGRYIALRKAA